MIPVLCDSSKTLTQIVADTTNGIGRINALSAVVTEERNGIYELEMSVFLEDKHFSDISVGSIVKVKAGELEGNQLFRVYQITKPINGVCTVYAHHITYDLGKAAVLPFTATGAVLALNGLIAHLADTYEFGVYTDISNNTSTFTLEEPKHFRECLGGYQGSMLDVFGGEYLFDNLMVKLLAHRGNDNGVSIRYGKNLTDIEQETNIEQMFTAALGFAIVDEITTVGDLQKIVEAPASKTKIIDFSDRFDSGDTVTKAQINALTQSYIDANDLNVPKINLKVSFVSLRDTEEYKNVAPLERVSLCDTVHVQFEKLGVNATAKVIRTEYDVLTERLISVEIGDARTSFAQSITSEIIDETEQTTASMLQSAINHATEMITGGLGGYVVLSRNANGEPEEILIMDKPDKAQAVNVIRMNKNGIGFSTTGYSGQYTTAWTIDGAFVADFITTGNLNANLIKVGTIQDAQQSNFWNMTTGEFKLSSAVEIDNDGDTLSSILNDIENDIDGKIETWYQATDPAGSWTTADMKAAHVGDIWYNTTDNTTQRYRLNGSTYEWQEMTVSDDVFDEIDGKATVFISEPVPPYSVGDLWFDSTSSDIKTCITARTTGSYTATDWQKRNKYTDDSALTSFLTNTYAPDKQTLEGLIDGKAETWYQLADPSTNWTVEEKPKHAGDLWYRTSDSTTWRYTGSAWQEQEAPDDVFDAIDGKCQVFTAQPTPPYNVGDLWFNSSTSDIKTCITPRTSSETYTAADWEKRNKYTDDSAVTTLDNSLDHSGVFNRLTNNGALQGIYMDGGQLYINATYIKSGTLVLGGNNNASGTLRINNASGTQIGKWDKDGINIQGGTFRETNGSAWLEMSSAELKGGYTGYSGQAECDLATTLNYSGNRKGAAALYHSNGYAWMEASRCFIIGSLHIGDSWGGGTWTGYTGTINGVGYFKNGILTT